MKRCNACAGTFDDSFEFCPTDGKALSRPTELTEPPLREYNITLVNNDGLPDRLKTELSFVLQQMRRTWPELRHDPLGVTNRVLASWAGGLKRAILAPHVAAATLTAMSLVFAMILTVIQLGEPRREPPAVTGTEDREQLVMIDLSSQAASREGVGVGMGSKGRVGLAVGKGEGSESESQASRGGGGGGDRSMRPAPEGGVPQPSEIPAPITPPLPNAMLPIAGVDLDPALWARLPLATYGDPRSKSHDQSNGPGEGGGVGTGSGQGVGDGRGHGIGPGEDGNIGGGRKIRGSGGIGGSDGNDPRDTDRVFTNDQVTQRARIVFKPEPQYTEEARRNQITGTAVLRVVFSLSGEVTNIRTVHPLPMGLTEKAIAAARQIRFIPATRNGRPVSVYVQLEYSFNLY